MAEVVLLDEVRARRLPVVIPPSNPQEKIKAAADLWMADRLYAVTQELVGRLQRSEKPLEPKERTRLMRASAALLGHPER